MSSRIVEQMVKKKLKHEDYAARVLVIMVCATIPVATFYLAVLFNTAFVSLAFVLLVICIYMIYRFIQGQKIEFEYEVSENVINFDKIIAKKNRKNVCALTIKHISLFAQIDDKRLSAKKFDKKFYACEDIDLDNTYVACFHAQKYGNCCIIFNPNKYVLDAMLPYFERDIYLEYRTAFKLREGNKD